MGEILTSFDEYVDRQLKRYGPNFYLQVDRSDPQKIEVTVLLERICKELEEVIQKDPETDTATNIKSLEGSLGVELGVQMAINLFTTTEARLDKLADQLAPGEQIRVLMPPNEEGWVPAVVHHDFENQAPVELGWVRYMKEYLIPIDCLDVSSNTTIEAFAEVIGRLLSHTSGITYQMSGKSFEAGYDCSGFTQTVIKSVSGFTLPRLARWQALVGEPIDQADLQAEDLVYFINETGLVDHVGLVYKVASGRLPTIVHCSLQNNGIYIEDLNEVSWLGDQRMIGGYRRVSPKNVARGN